MDRERETAEKGTARYSHYGSGSGYWDSQYEKHPRPYEWLRTYDEVSDLLEEATASNRKVDILHVGCGNSMLSERMYDAGYSSIVNIDVSHVVLSQMSARNKRTRPEIQWLQMDATSMDFGDAVFDVVVDKSLLDTLACTPYANRATTMEAYISEVVRVLRPGGVFLCISFGDAASRKAQLDVPDLQLVAHELPSKGHIFGSHFAYFCRKIVPLVSDSRNTAPLDFRLDDMD